MTSTVGESAPNQLKTPRCPVSNLSRAPLSFAFAAVLALTAGIAPAPLPAQESVSSDSVAVARVVERLHDALAAADTVLVMSLLLPDALILESGGLESRDEYRSHHLSADIEFAQSIASDRGPMKVRVDGNTAWPASLTGVKGTFRGREIDVQGSELMVLRRGPEGWRIAAIHWSSRDR